MGYTLLFSRSCLLAAGLVLTSSHIAIPRVEGSAVNERINVYQRHTQGYPLKPWQSWNSQQRATAARNSLSSADWWTSDLQARAPGLLTHRRLALISPLPVRMFYRTTCKQARNITRDPAHVFPTTPGRLGPGIYFYSNKLDDWPGLDLDNIKLSDWIDELIPVALPSGLCVIPVQVDLGKIWTTPRYGPVSFVRRTTWPFPTYDSAGLVVSSKIEKAAVHDQSRIKILSSWPLWIGMSYYY